MSSILLLGGIALVTQLLKKKQQECPIPSFKGIIETSHYLPGRVRFRIPILKSDPSAITVLEDQLNKMNVINNVSITQITGSVLISYKENELEPIVLLGAIIKLLGLDVALDQTRISCITKQIAAIKKLANDSIYDATNGILDLNILLTLFLAGSSVYAMRGRLRNIISPGPAVLAWWTYNTL